MSQFSRTSWPAVALNHLLAISVVVIGELFTWFDVAPGADPDVVADDLAIAIGLAGVVDEPRDVAARPRIADPVRCLASEAMA